MITLSASYHELDGYSSLYPGANCSHLVRAMHFSWYMFRSYHQQTPRYWTRVHNWVITRRKSSIQSWSTQLAINGCTPFPIKPVMYMCSGPVAIIRHHACNKQIAVMFSFGQANVISGSSDSKQAASTPRGQNDNNLLNCPSVGPLENQRFQWAPAGHDGSHVLHVYNMPPAWYCKFGPKVTTMHNMPPNCYLVRLKQQVFC